MGRKIKFTAACKAKVALEAVKEQQSVNELAKRFDIALAKVTEWKDEFIKNAAQAFEKPESNKRQVKKLKAMNDRLLQIIALVIALCCSADSWGGGRATKKCAPISAMPRCRWSTLT